MLRRIQADRALLGRGNLSDITRIVVMFFETPFGEKTTMRWKISRHGHDPRQIDLLAAIVLVILIISAFGYFEDKSSPQQQHPAAFIVPSQNVRW